MKPTFINLQIALNEIKISGKIIRCDLPKHSGSVPWCFRLVGIMDSGKLDNVGARHGSDRERSLFKVRKMN